MARPQTALSLVPLEDRLAPALTIRFDYSFDANGFFRDPARRAVLEQAGADLAGRIGTTLAAITPAAGDAWTALFYHPATGAQAQVANLTVPNGGLVVYVGGRNLEAAEAGEGGAGGYRISGNSIWIDRVQHRGHAGFSLWGGAISFDTDQDWYFGPDPAGLRADQTDFYTVATHELGHVLGIGTAREFTDRTVGNTFTGPAATAENGGRPPQLSADLAHWAQGTTSEGQPASLEPYLVLGKRYGFSPIDYAALSDLGWQVTAVSPPAGGVVPPVSPPASPPPTTPVPVNTTPPAAGTPLTADTLALSGQADGTISLTTPGGSSRMFRPFPDFAGEVRAAVADVTGDGVPDLIAVPGSGGGSRVRVTDGKTGADVASSAAVFEAGFTGGLYVAAADLNADGKADVIVSPDRGGGGRVTVLTCEAGQLRPSANFFGIDDPNFRGGARVAAADVDGDGRADLIVGAGYGGGPRVAIFDGRSITTGTPRRLVGDFFAFPGADLGTLQNGVFVAAGDLTGDGRAELAFGGGPGGGPRVLVLDGAAVAANPVAAVEKPRGNFFAFDASQRGGVRVAVRNGSLIVGSGEGAAATARLYAGGDPVRGTALDPFGGAVTAGGVYVG